MGLEIREAAMETRTVMVEVPEELIQLLGSPEAVAEKAKEALVLDLLRRAEISQGTAAILLDVTRWDILDLMALHEIPSGPVTAEEVRQETESLERWLDAQKRREDGNSKQ
jgi:hypothetical protein